ncbi:MAG: amidase family protein, partial [Pseudomonadota bacterium]
MNSARETAAAVRSGRSSAIAETEAAIQRIEADDPAINAVVVRRFEAARRDAQAVDARLNTGEDLPLAGVAMTVKESFDVAGLPTTWGMMDHADHRADADAEIVRRLKMAGAVILGKTNVPPMLADWQSANPVYGVTRNPHDRARVPGGSSGGAAAALASHMVPLEYGSDIGGSVRVPAGFCGVWGLKTSYGAVPMGGHFLPGLHGAPAEMGVCGPLARAPEDLRLALELTAAVPLDRRVPDTLAGLRIAPLFTHPVAGVRDEIGKVGQATLDAAARAGAEIVEDVPWPDLAAMHADYVRLLLTTIGRGQPLPDGTQPVTL